MLTGVLQVKAAVGFNPEESFVVPADVQVCSDSTHDMLTLSIRISSSLDARKAMAVPRHGKPSSRSTL